MLLRKPLPSPEMIGKVDRRTHRPIPIVLLFDLHPDGKVYQKTESGSRRIPDKSDVTTLVHDAYNRDFKRAMQQGQFRKRVQSES